ncbi:hypothetical protein HAX54_004490, partial [Datura stramonium]|nr:hypothetical protein [Datura stramonium]
KSLSSYFHGEFLACKLRFVNPSFYSLRVSRKTHSPTQEDLTISSLKLQVVFYSYPIAIRKDRAGPRSSISANAMIESDARVLSGTQGMQIRSQCHLAGQHTRPSSFFWTLDPMGSPKPLPPQQPNALDVEFKGSDSDAHLTH